MNNLDTLFSYMQSYAESTGRELELYTNLKTKYAYIDCLDNDTEVTFKAYFTESSINGLEYDSFKTLMDTLYTQEYLRRQWTLTKVG